MINILADILKGEGGPFGSEENGEVKTLFKVIKKCELLPCTHMSTYWHLSSKPVRLGKIKITLNDV